MNQKKNNAKRYEVDDCCACKCLTVVYSQKKTAFLEKCLMTSSNISGGRSTLKKLMKKIICLHQRKNTSNAYCT